MRGLVVCLLVWASAEIATAGEIVIARSAVVSSHLVSAGYDAKSRVLEIEFRSGGVYRYFKVPKKIFTQLLVASSKGHFFEASIKGRYKHRQMVPPMKGRTRGQPAETA